MTLHPRLRQGRVGILLIIPMAFVLAACSSKSASTSSTSNETPAVSASTATTTSTIASTANFNSCSVVTQNEATSAIGASVTPGVLGNATVEGGLACVFYGPSAPTPTTPDVAQVDTVRVVVVKGSDAMTWYDDYKSKVTAQPIDGYGDQAFYDGHASLSVLKGDTYVRIAVAPAGAPPSLTGEEQLAMDILQKL